MAKELLVVDNYIDAELFDVYFRDIPPAIAVRVLTNQPSTTVVTLAQKYSARGNFELRASGDVNDRVVLADDRCWVVGQSIKDAAKKKPTYIIEFQAPDRMKSISRASGQRLRQL